MSRLPYPSILSASMAEEKKEHRVPIEWRIPDHIISRYATNLVAQRTENEFVLSFFELHPTLILGEIPDNIESIPAECVGRIIIARDKMPEFVSVLQEHLRKATEASQTEEQ